MIQSFSILSLRSSGSWCNSGHRSTYYNKNTVRHRLLGKLLTGHNLHYVIGFLNFYKVIILDYHILIFVHK